MESNINCLLLSLLHLEIRNNDRINLDYRLVAIKTILLTRQRGGKAPEWVLQLPGGWLALRSTMKGRKLENKCAEMS
jgi:hypothetical protein